MLWSLTGKTAVLNTAPPPRIAVDLEERVLLCQAASAAESPADVQPSKLLRIAEPELKLRGTAYVRGNDLIAQYVAGEGQLFVEVYWRRLACDPTAGEAVEVIVSAETNRLDYDPSLRVVSEVLAAETLRGEGWSLSRHPRLATAYLEMGHPSNHGQSDFDESASTGGIRVARQLFPGRLEKGVIRRARLRACFPEPTFDEARAESAYRSFLGSPIPLTT